MLYDRHCEASQQISLIQKGQPCAAFYLTDQEPAYRGGGKGCNEQKRYPQVEYAFHTSQNASCYLVDSA